MTTHDNATTGRPEGSSRPRTRPAELSASAYGDAELCPARFAFAVPHAVDRTGRDAPAARADDDGLDAERGTLVHRTLELRLRGHAPGDAFAVAAKELGRRPHHTWKKWALAHDPHELLPPGYRWTPETRWVVTLAGLEVGGTPDAVGVRGLRGEEAHVVDFKTMRLKASNCSLPAAWDLAFAELAEQKARRHDLQLRFHAVAALEHTRAERVTTETLYLGPEAVLGERRATLTRADGPAARRSLEVIVESVQAARALPDPTEAARPGLYCRYCPAANACLRSGEVKAPWSR